ncbi:MAG: response regulator [Erysipelotrichaceae bacterium]|nr:response regulator [Erysipelotrichaceae bacterium]
MDHEDRKRSGLFHDVRELNHEMRTPLNTILLLSKDLKKESSLPSKRRTQVVQIERSAYHLLDLVNNVLDLSRIEEGRCDLHEERFDLRELTDDLKLLILPLAQEKKIRFTIREEFKDPCYEGDALKLKQILINVLSNAVKYTPKKGSVHFIARAMKREEESDLLHFEIKDSGEGIAEDLLPRIFEAYATEKERIGSSGLGLYIAKRYIDLLKGRITVFSRKNKGTRVIIEIPLRRGKEEKIQDKEDLSCSLKGRKILIAEDVVINARILENLLRSYGAKTVSAENGNVALEIFLQSRTGEFDALLLDVHMPLLDGRRVTEKIRQSGRTDKDVKIIALSGDNSKEDIEESLNAGMDVHLCKPIDPDLLIGTLQDLLKNED